MLLQILNSQLVTTKLGKSNVPREWRHYASFPNEFIIGNSNEKMQTRASLKKQASVALVSQMEPKRLTKALEDESWIRAMKEELDQFERNQILGSYPKNKELLSHRS